MRSALRDVRVRAAVDAQGRRMPTHQARVDFTRIGPAAFLGGFNPGKPGSVHKPYLDTEAGVNRVFIRASRTPGTIALRATATGLTAATASVTSVPFAVTAGLTTQLPATY